MKLTRLLILIMIIAIISSFACCGVYDEIPDTPDVEVSETLSQNKEESKGSSLSEKQSLSKDSESLKDSATIESASEKQSESKKDSVSENTSESLKDSESEKESQSEVESESESEEESIPEDDVPEIDESLLIEADNRYVTLDIQNKISTQTGWMSFITRSSYKGIKRIIFNAKTGETTSWWGLAIATDKRKAGLYNTDLTTGTGTGGYWMTFVYEFSGTGCAIYVAFGERSPKVVTELTTVPYSEDGQYYIYFVGPRGEEFSELICIDNFTIELFDGTTYVDTFDEGANDGLFKTDSAVSHVVDDSYVEEIPEEDETPLYETYEDYYKTDDVIDFTAYAPVTVQNWAGSGTSNPNLVTDEQYRYMAEAGFTKSLGLYEGRTGDSGLTSNEKAEKDALAVLEIAQKYGIKYYVLNEKFYNFVRPGINLEFFDLTYKNGVFYNKDGEEVSSFDSYRYLKSNWQDLYKEKMSKMFDANTKYIDSPAYGGNFASDEPALPIKVNGKWYYGELEQLYYQILYYNEYMTANSKNGGEAYVNLNPYVNVNDNNRERYDAMLKYYFKNIAPLLGYVCYDQYPLNYSSTAYVSATHLLNLEMMASYCKQYGIELRSFVWAKIKMGAGHRALINANDLRFQTYANLVFGVKEMPYYTYFNYYAPGADACDSLIDCQTGAKTKAYYWAKEVNNEIHALEKAYLNFTWVGSMFFDSGKTSQQFSLLEKTLTSHKRLINISGNTDVLVGAFSDADGANGATDGFVVMNYSDPYYAKKGDKKNVVLTFDNATHVLVYKGGKQYEAKLTDGKLSMYLDAGEGAFVIPFNK